MVSRRHLAVALVSACALAGAACSSKKTAASDSSFVLRGSTSVSGSSLGSLVASGSPTMFKMNLYALYVSENDDCTSPVLVSDYGSTPQEFNLIDNPTLFSASPANGTYRCVILKMQDTMTFKADATAVAAHAGCADTDTVYTFDIHRASDPAWKDIDGNATSASGTMGSPSADTVYIFASMNASAVQAGAIGAHAYQTVTLTSAMQVPGAATMTMDITNSIENQTDENSVNRCWLEQIAFGFE